MIVVGNKLYDRCPNCGNIIQLNKPIFGSMHFCLTDEEEKAKQHNVMLGLDRYHQPLK